MSDCGGIECLVACEEASKKDLKPPPYKMCSEKSAFHFDEDEELPKALASPYNLIRRELAIASAGASAPMIEQVEAIGGNWVLLVLRTHLGVGKLLMS